MRHASPRSLIVLAALAALAAARPAPGGAADLTGEFEGRTSRIATVDAGRDDLVDLEEVAAAFRFELDQEGRKEAVLRRPEGTVRVRAGRAVVLVNDQPFILAAEVKLQQGALLVPRDFVTRAVARLLGIEARVDEADGTVRFDSRPPTVTCESFNDRIRVTVHATRPPQVDPVVRDGRRRIVTITNQELPPAVAACAFDDTLEDLEIASDAGQTRLTFFVGSKFTNLTVHEIPEERSLVLDFFGGEAAVEIGEVTAGRTGPRREVFDTVVIDPGHGGPDRGAVSAAGLEEKELTLAIANEVAALLRKEGLDVILTREADVAVSLGDRTALANQAQADLFMSIHANATPARGAVGAETYFLSAEATDEPSRSLAALENDATGLRGSGGPSGGDLEVLLWDMAQQQYLAESSVLADTVQRELNILAGTRDRGVKQAAFLVLRGATMPAVLVEVGFLSTPSEERKMRGAEFRSATAEALARAVRAFRDRRAAAGVP